MISADPTVPDPLNAQSWNRYSYVGNDPLAFTDPSGFSWLSSFFHSVSHAVSSVAHFLTSNPIVRAVVQIAIAAVLTITGVGAIIAAAASAAIVTGLSGGNLGQILQASVIAGATAFAFSEVGDLTGHTPGFGTPAYAENVIGHALVGCASSAASGGSCESGALSGAVTAGAGPLINGQAYGVALVENTVLGGAASVAGGGKFANGAITGAFGYMFNAMGGRIVGGVIGGLLEGVAGIETGPGDALIIAHGIYTWGELGSRFEDWITGSFSPINPGPLAQDIAVNFRSGSYEGRMLSEDTTFYRVIGDGGNPNGPYWTSVPPSGPLQSVIDSALDQNWGNPATTTITRTFPAGTTVFEGAAAPQRGLVGGGNQVYIPGALK